MSITKTPKKPIIKLINGLLNIPLKVKKAHRAGNTDNMRPIGLLLSLTFVAKPHKTPDMNARITVPYVKFMLAPLYSSLSQFNLEFSKLNTSEVAVPQKKGIKPAKPKIKAEVGIFVTLVLLKLLVL